MQKKILSITVLITFLFSQKVWAQNAAAPISITELGVFEPAETEWIEIYNATTTQIDLSGWKFFEDETNHGIKEALGDLILEPNEYAIIANNAEAFQQKYPEYIGTLFDSSWGTLKEEGEAIGLKDNDGNFVEQISYAPQESLNTGVSLERISENWIRHPTAHSLGKQNEAVITTPPNEIQKQILPPCENQQEPVQETTEIPLAETPLAETPPAEIPPATIPLPTGGGGGSYSSQPLANATKPVFKKTAIVPKSAQPKPAPQNIPVLKDAMISLRGYLVFVPQEEILEKSKTQKTEKRKNKPQKSKKTQTKVKYQNGDRKAGLRITEIFPQPTTEDSDEEWIEIFNSSNKIVNLGNWGLADKSRVDSPYRISDEINLSPGEYKIFPKSETRLALNNTADSVTLTDFEGTVIDSVSYDKSKPGESYALIEVIGGPDLVASTKPLLRQRKKWEWTALKTPAFANPTFEKLEGAVKSFTTGALYIAERGGGTKKINFTEETLDPLIAEVAMKEGTHITLYALQKSDGDYELEKIEKVEQAAITEKESGIPWMVISIFALSIALIWCVWRLWVRVYFQKDKNVPHEIAGVQL